MPSTIPETTLLVSRGTFRSLSSRFTWAVQVSPKPLFRQIRRCRCRLSRRSSDDQVSWPRTRLLCVVPLCFGAPFSAMPYWYPRRGMVYGPGPCFRVLIPCRHAQGHQGMRTGEAPRRLPMTPQSFPGRDVLLTGAFAVLASALVDQDLTVTVRPGDRLTIRYDGPHLPDRDALEKALPGVELVLVLVEQRRRAAEQAAARACAILTEAGVAPLLAADLVTAMRQAGDDPVTFARNFAWLRGTLNHPVPAGLLRVKAQPGWM